MTSANTHAAGKPHHSQQWSELNANHVLTYCDALTEAFEVFPFLCDNPPEKKKKKNPDWSVEKKIFSLCTHQQEGGIA